MFKEKGVVFIKMQGGLCHFLHSLAVSVTCLKKAPHKYILNLLNLTFTSHTDINGFAYDVDSFCLSQMTIITYYSAIQNLPSNTWHDKIRQNVSYKKKENTISWKNNAITGCI